MPSLPAMPLSSLFGSNMMPAFNVKCQSDDLQSAKYVLLYTIFEGFCGARHT